MNKSVFSFLHQLKRGNAHIYCRVLCCSTTAASCAVIDRHLMPAKPTAARCSGMWRLNVGTDRQTDRRPTITQTLLCSADHAGSANKLIPTTIGVYYL